MEYLLEKNRAMTSDVLSKILQKFNTHDRPYLQRMWNYYEGKQPILQKQATDVGKPCNKVVVNYCNSIVNNFLGYLTGIPISYDNDDFDEVKNVLNYNDVVTEDSEFLRQALIYGVAYEVNYIDEYGKQRFRLFDPRECIPVYDNTLSNDLMYVVRYYKETLVDDLMQDRYLVEVYSAFDIKRYRSNSGFSSFELIEEVPHFYGQVPVTVFDLNSDGTSIFDQITTLQDSYNSILSASLDDFESFCDAYLVLKGCTASDEDLINMKKNRVLMMDADCTAEYLVKQVNDAQLQNLLTGIADKIHKIANSPDFNDKEMGTAASGIALRLRLVGFENVASNIEANMKMALIKRIELISEICKLTDVETIWRDVQITFTRNLPYDLTEAVNTVNALRGVVSTRTLLTLLPFVKDVDAELALVEQEKLENMELYRYDTVETNIDTLSEPKSAVGEFIDE